MRQDIAASLWMGLPETEVLYERFDDICVLYHRGSGETHYLNATAIEIFKLLQRGPLRVAEVVAEIRDIFDMDATQEPELCAHIGRVIQEFDHVGLICPVPPPSPT